MRMISSSEPMSISSPYLLMPSLYMMSNSATRKGGADLVLHYAGAHSVAQDIRALLEGFQPTEVDAYGAIELQRATAGCNFRVAEENAYLLTKLVDENHAGV